MFFHRNEAGMTFAFELAKYTEANNPDVKSIEASVGKFEGGAASLEEYLPHSPGALQAYYTGQLPLDAFRTTKVRENQLKTTLKQAIMFLKVFPSLENQTFYIVSPRKVVVYGVVQMVKVFYSDHYFVETLYHFDEQLLRSQDGRYIHITTMEARSNLKFVKQVNLIRQKVREYYEVKVKENFNLYVLPRLE
mmetsp:Transcript_3860/g.2859  ORF Transcript_3860/g.2859 Transcript_3860/m.2859 type:complete len:192 (+) Transcript_3860:682-1257(+)|eukprot:CAMPEP_0202972236 /NCGR_PEP_ID=MMETSP1396-20130829/34635_1 /ASSEMBLY_ACC=CAM_ASM_000872 /TAXON_ID= /ORGANISM="Pseudokeronopsis sp., Strain Brazil" /LENGTH=191 /DNA_ID=CAMNT_0049702423 /DNA_START=682 /DNA_END=1257 /DNA_ORIENTATION=-